MRSRSTKVSRVTADAPADKALAGRSDAATPSGPAENTGPGRHVGRAEARTASRRTSAGRALKNRRASVSYAFKHLRVRSRLLLIVIVPTIAAVTLGGFRIISSVRSEQADQRIQQLALLGQDDTSLIQALEDERDHTVYYIALGANGGRASVLASAKARTAMTASQLGVQYAATNQAMAKVRGVAQQIGGSYPREARQQASVVLTALEGLQGLRADAAETGMPVLTVITRYAQIVGDLIALNNDIATNAGDPVLAQDVSSLVLVSQMKEEASQQRAILAAALLQGAFGRGELTALQNAVSAQQTNLQAFDGSASPSQLQLWNADVAASFGNQASADELLAISLATNARGSGSLGSDPTTADDWYNTMTNTIEYQMGPVQRQLVADVTSRAAALRSNAITDAVAGVSVVLLILILAVLFTAVIGQSMVRPLQRLRAGALEVAGVRLPDMVRRMSEADGAGVSFDVAPIDVDSSDEIGEVARAFDQVHREALRLAANEAALRGNVNAMFVNLSRRSQSLVERQIRLIDDLEQGEQDPERLSNLFQMDHLATRMRRNSENLLVLAGHEVSRRWNQPVALVDVLRAAVSEIEQYERVSMNVQPGIAVRGQAVNDVVHLVAELVENATSFSSAETPVTVSGHLLNSGGVLLDISDQGVGMGAEEMAHANWRLDNPPVVDVAVSRRMGLFVVARLAARHGIRVRLRPAPTGGLTALVWLPDETVTHESAGSGPGSRRFDRNGGTPDSIEPVTNGQLSPEWGGRSAAEDAVNAARAPRFTPLHTENGDAATTAGFPAVNASWDDPLTRSSGNAWENGKPAGAGWDDTPAKPATAGWDDGAGQPASPAWGEAPDKDAGPSWDDAPAKSAGSAWEEPLSPPAAAPPPAAATGPLPSVSGNGGPKPSFGTQPPAGSPGLPTRLPSRPSRGFGNGGSNDSGPIRREVVVPPAAPLGQGNRLPIFESVESDWFRRGRHSAERANGPNGGNGGNGGSAPGAAQVAAEPAPSWTSAADEGWRAAEAVSKPASGGVTLSGLPKRVPKANLVPGTVGTSSQAAPPPIRSAAMTRDRFAAFQRGVREARAAADDDQDGGGEGDGVT